jgi:hypothetical protein
MALNLCGADSAGAGLLERGADGTTETVPANGTTDHHRRKAMTVIKRSGIIDFPILRDHPGNVTKPLRPYTFAPAAKGNRRGLPKTRSAASVRRNEA